MIFIKKKNLFQSVLILIFSETLAHLCEKCGKSFATLGCLKIHKMSSVHDKIPKFQCPDCPKTFSLKHNLKIHSEIHRENNYECEICQAQFHGMHSYKRHKSIEFNSKLLNFFISLLNH